jgi:superoxide reductase
MDALPNIFGKINLPKEGDFDDKHTPYIEIVPKKFEKGKPFEVRIRVGKSIRHPMEAGHFIQWIQLYAGENLVGMANLSPVISEPFVSFMVVLNEKTRLSAVMRCNLHGDWKYSVDVKL